MAKRKRTRPIICEIEAAHDRETGNSLCYTVEGLASSIPSWTTPYLKPFILFHDDETGKCIGRTIKAEVRDSVKLPGYKALVLTVRVTDGEGIRGIIDRRYLTVSIGAKSKEVECSICNKMIENPKSPCHVLGQYYSGNKCIWIIHNMTAEELSAVIVPSDKYAQIINWHYENEPDEVFHFTESLHSKEKNITTSTPLERIGPMSDIKNQEEPTTVVSTAVEGKEKEDNKDLLIKENARLQNELDAVSTENGVLKERINLLQGDLSKEKLTREAAETALGTYKVKERENVLSDFVSIREKLNLRPLTTEELETKTIDYLEVSILDMKQDLAFKESQIVTNDDSEKLKDLKSQNTEIKITEKQNTNVEDGSDVADRISSIVKNII